MFTEAERFQEEHERLQSIIEGLNVERIKLQAKRSVLESDYSELIIDADASEPQIAKHKASIQKVEQQIGDLTDRISAIQSNIGKHMKSIMPSVVQGRDREAREALAEYQRNVKEARRLKAELLLHYGEMSKVVGRLRSVIVTSNDAANVSNAPEYKIRNEYPTPNFFSIYEGEDKLIGITQQETLDAYNSGRLPIWVKVYAETGEVFLSDAKAREYLRSYIKERDEK